MLYIVRRVNCSNLSNIPSFEELMAFEHYEDARKFIEDLSEKEFMETLLERNHILQETMAEYFSIKLPEYKRNINGFPICYLSHIIDIDSVLDDWWDVYFDEIMYPYWDMVKKSNIDDNDEIDFGRMEVQWTVENGCVVCCLQDCLELENI